MINRYEKDERTYLEEKKKLRNTFHKIDSNVSNYAKELQAKKDYVYENKAGMDHAEKISVRQSVQTAALTGEAEIERKKRLQKLLLSPYFGRFDFAENGNENEIVKDDDLSTLF